MTTPPTPTAAPAQPSWLEIILRQVQLMCSANPDDREPHIQSLILYGKRHASGIDALLDSGEMK